MNRDRGKDVLSSVGKTAFFGLVTVIFGVAALMALINLHIFGAMFYISIAAIGKWQTGKAMKALNPGDGYDYKQLR